MPDEDVKDAGSSPAGEQADQQQNTDATAVTGEPSGGDRPLQNTVAEFNRRFAKTQQQLDTVLQWIASQAVTQQQATRQPAQVDKSQVSDEDLWALAQQGDRQAFEMYQERIADRRIKQEAGIQNRTRLVQGQLAALMGKYPVLNNPQHPLTQYVNAAYAAYLQNGYPQGQETLLEAAKTAIADRPDLVAELHTQGAVAREGVRRNATQNAQSGVTGVSHRQQSSPNTGGTKKLTPDQLALAKRMGLSPEKAQKAVKGFLQRQEDGLSKLGAVSGFVDSEEL